MAIITTKDIAIEFEEYAAERDASFAAYAAEAAFCAAPWDEVDELRAVLLPLGGLNPSVTAAKLRQKLERRYVRLLKSLPECEEREALLNEWLDHEWSCFEECMGENL